MKKFLMCLISLLCLSSCALVPKGKYIHIQTYHTANPIHLKIKDYHTSTSYIETESFGTIYIKDMPFLIYGTDNCPICGRVTYYEY